MKGHASLSFCWSAAALVLGVAQTCVAQTNIDSTNMHAWGENVGWTNWHDAANGAAGARIGNTFLSGNVWAENVGWINLGNGTPANGTSYSNSSASDSGVNIAPDGLLTGLAWGENVGWIAFTAAPAGGGRPQTAYLGCDGRMHGYAWGENIGWINLSLTHFGEFVAVNSQTQPVACDVNHDGVADGSDVQAFVNLLINGGATWRDLCSADVGSPNDGTIDPGDVAAFAACLVNG